MRDRTGEAGYNKEQRETDKNSEKEAVILNQKQGDIKEPEKVSVSSVQKVHQAGQPEAPGKKKPEKKTEKKKETSVCTPDITRGHFKQEVTKEKFKKIPSRSDGLMLEVLQVVPRDKVKGIVQIAHGMQEHKERYLDFMSYLASEGYACIAHDHRGHGESVKDPSDLGYFYDQKAEAIVDDLNDVQDYMRIRYPHVPVYLLGHSMGSLIVRKYLKKYDDRISGLILSGPVYNNPGAKAGLNLVKAMATLRGDHFISASVQKMVDGSFDRHIEGDQKNRWLSHNEESVQAFNDDEKCGFPFTLNGYGNLLQLVLDVYDKKGWQLKNPDLPVLFLGGEEDPVIGSPEEFQKTVQSLKDMGYNNVQSRLYPNMRHEILNEINRRQVYEDILTFLEKEKSV